MNRSQQIDKATQEAYHTSRRPRRPRILQVPTVAALEVEGMKTPQSRKTGTKRPIVVPFAPNPISWSEARRRGEAYGRVLSSNPFGAWPPPEILVKMKERAAKLTEQRQLGIKRAPRFKRDPRGMWWMDKFADAVDRRKDIRYPSHSRWYEAKDDEPKPVEEVAPLPEGGATE